MGFLSRISAIFSSQSSSQGAQSGEKKAKSSQTKRGATSLRLESLESREMLAVSPLPGGLFEGTYTAAAGTIVPVYMNVSQMTGYNVATLAIEVSQGSGSTFDPDLIVVKNTVTGATVTPQYRFDGTKSSVFIAEFPLGQYTIDVKADAGTGAFRLNVFIPGGPPTVPPIPTATTVLQAQAAVKQAGTKWTAADVTYYKAELGSGYSDTMLATFSYLDANVDGAMTTADVSLIQANLNLKTITVSMTSAPVEVKTPTITAITAPNVAENASLAQVNLLSLIQSQLTGRNVADFDITVNTAAATVNGGTPVPVPSGVLSYNAATGFLDIKVGSEFHFLAAGTNAVITFSYKVTDNNRQADKYDTPQTANVTFQVTGANSAPTITNSAAIAVTVDADKTSTGVAIGTNITVTDPDHASGFTFAKIGNLTVAASGTYYVVYSGGSYVLQTNNPGATGYGTVLVTGGTSFAFTPNKDNEAIKTLLAGASLDPITLAVTVKDTSNLGSANSVNVVFTVKRPAVGGNPTLTVTSPSPSILETNTADTKVGTATIASATQSDVYNYTVTYNGITGSTFGNPTLVLGTDFIFRVGSNNTATIGSNGTATSDMIFAIQNATKFQFIPAGQTLTLSFIVAAQKSDGAALTSQTVSVTITGTNFVPTATYTASRIDVPVTGGTNPTISIGATVNKDIIVTDNDYGDTHTFATVGSNNLAAVLGATYYVMSDNTMTTTNPDNNSHYGTITFADGVRSFTFTPNAANTTLANLTGFHDLSISVTVKDSTGAASTPAVSIPLRITGTKVQTPLITGFTIGNTTEDSANTTPNILSSITSQLGSRPASDFTIAVNDTSAKYTYNGTQYSVPTGFLSYNASTGVLTVSPSGKFDFLPQGGTANVVITFTVKDDKSGATNTAIQTANITFSVTGVNDKPVATAPGTIAFDFNTSQPVTVGSTSGLTQIQVTDKDSGDDVTFNTVSNVTVVTGSTYRVVVDTNGIATLGSVIDGTNPLLATDLGSVRIGSGTNAKIFIFTPNANNTALRALTIASPPYSVTLSEITLKDKIGAVSNPIELKFEIKGTAAVPAPSLTVLPATLTVTEGTTTPSEVATVTVAYPTATSGSYNFTDGTATVTAKDFIYTGLYPPHLERDIDYVLEFTDGDDSVSKKVTFALTSTTKFDFIPAGGKLTITIPITARKNSETSLTQTITVIIIGTNSKPTITASLDGNATTKLSGTTPDLTQTVFDPGYVITDPDAGDTRAYSVTSFTAAGSAGVTVVTPTDWTAYILPIDNAGKITLKPDAFKNLKAGEKITLTFTVTVTDGGGESATTADLTITVKSGCPAVVNPSISTSENTVGTSGVLSVTPSSVSNPWGVTFTSPTSVKVTVNSVKTNVTLAANAIAYDDVTKKFTFNPGTAFDYLPQDVKATFNVNFTVTDTTTKLSTPAILTIEVTGEDEAPTTFRLQGKTTFSEFTAKESFKAKDTDYAVRTSGTATFFYEIGTVTPPADDSTAPALTDFVFIDARTGLFTVIYGELGDIPTGGWTYTFAIAAYDQYGLSAGETDNTIILTIKSSAPKFTDAEIKMNATATGTSFTSTPVTVTDPSNASHDDSKWFTVSTTDLSEATLTGVTVTPAITAALAGSFVQFVKTGIFSGYWKFTPSAALLAAIPDAEALTLTVSVMTQNKDTATSGTTELSIIIVGRDAYGFTLQPTAKPPTTINEVTSIESGTEYIDIPLAKFFSVTMIGSNVATACHFTIGDVTVAASDFTNNSAINTAILTAIESGGILSVHPDFIVNGTPFVNALSVNLTELETAIGAFTAGSLAFEVPIHCTVNGETKIFTMKFTLIPSGELPLEATATNTTLTVIEDVTTPPVTFTVTGGSKNYQVSDAMVDAANIIVKQNGAEITGGAMYTAIMDELQYGVTAGYLRTIAATAGTGANANKYTVTLDASKFAWLPDGYSLKFGMKFEVSDRVTEETDTVEMNCTVTGKNSPLTDVSVYTITPESTHADYTASVTGTAIVINLTGVSSTQSVEFLVKYLFGSADLQALIAPARFTYTIVDIAPSVSAGLICIDSTGTLTVEFDGDTEVEYEFRIGVTENGLTNYTETITVKITKIV